MLYIGHFSYDELDEQNATRHGYFTCLVDAENPDEAVALFTEYILEKKKSKFFFANIVKVYIEDIIKVPAVPSSPMTTTIQSCEGSFPKSISYSLPFDSPDGAEVYGLPSNVNRHEQIESKDYLESEPFIEFKAPIRHLAQ
jgi:hypothetical protein